MTSVTNVVQYYYPGIGGAIRFIRTTGRLLVRRGHCISVITSTGLDNRSLFSLRHGRRSKPGSEDDQGVKVQRIEPIIVPYLQNHVPLLRPGGAIPELLLKAGRDPDILHVHCLPYAHMVWSHIASRIGNKPLVVTPDIKHGMSIVPEVLKAISGARALAVRTRWEAEYIARTYGIVKDTCVVGMGVEIETFSKADLSLASGMISRGESPPLILFSGRATRAKGFGTLTKALQQMREDCHLAVAGSLTPYARRCLREMDRGLRNRVDVIGPILDDRLLASLYRNSSVVAYPSGDDSFGAVIIEAWAARKPVVACEIGGPGVLVEPGVNGLFAEYGNARDLAEKLDMVLRDRKLARRLGSRGYGKAKDYSWTKCADRLELLYESIAGR